MDQLKLLIWFHKYSYSPPVTRKYESRTKTKTVFEDGFWTHVGFFSFKCGGSSTRNGRLYRVSSIFTGIRSMELTGADLE